MSENIQPQYIYLNHFGFLKISGVDAISFLQGYTTCDLSMLQDKEAQLGAICNIQGRMLASFIVIQQEQDLILRMHKSLVTKIVEFLNKYIVFSKATLTDISKTLLCYGSLALDSMPRTSPFTVKTNADSIIVDLGNRLEHWKSAKESTYSEKSITTWFDAELEAGIAWVDQKTTAKHLPQTLNYHQLGGISFDKGCYLGQEVIARMKYRGALKKQLHRIDVNPKNRTLKIGNIINEGSTSCLAVITNSTKEEIRVTWSDGSTDIATPL